METVAGLPWPVRHHEPLLDALDVPSTPLFGVDHRSAVHVPALEAAEPGLEPPLQEQVLQERIPLLEQV